MKTIGKTNEGQILIEITPDEYHTLAHLAHAIEGRTLEEVRVRDRNSGLMPDFSGVFGAIEAFTLAHYRINDLENLINEFRRAVNNQNDQR